MKKISILISILIISIILLNGCGQKEITKEKDIPHNLVDLEIGKTPIKEKLEINLISVEKVNSYYDPYLKEMSKVKPEYTFVLIEVELKNVYTENIRAGAMEFYLKDDKGEVYNDRLYYSDNEEEGGLDIFTELKPNEKISGKLLFGILKPIKDFKIQYDPRELN